MSAMQPCLYCSTRIPYCRCAEPDCNKGHSLHSPEKCRDALLAKFEQVRDALQPFANASIGSLCFLPYRINGVTLLTEEDFKRAAHVLQTVRE